MDFENGLSVADWAALTRQQFSRRPLSMAEAAMVAPPPCPAVDEFKAWVETHVITVKREPTYQQAVEPQASPETINKAKEALIQAKLRLQDAFFRFYFPASRYEQDQLFHTYKETFLELEHLLNLVAPPPLVQKVVIKEVTVEKHVEYEPLLIERME